MTARLGSASDQRTRLAFSIARVLAVAIRLWILLPIAIGIAMFLIAPSYMSELLRSPVGWLLLVLAMACVAGAYAVGTAAVQFLRTGRSFIGLMLVLVSTVVLTFLALWLLLLGPALAVFIEHPS